MREIKFRAWQEKGKRMIPAEYVAVAPPDSRFSKWCISGDGTTIRSDCEDFVLMQYTGHKDKNGTEIYEGDLIKIVEPIEEVRWHFNRWVLIDEKNRINEIRMLDVSYFYEVIGNIYESPRVNGKLPSNGEV